MRRRVLHPATKALSLVTTKRFVDRTMLLTTRSCGLMCVHVCVSVYVSRLCLCVIEIADVSVYVSLSHFSFSLSLCQSVAQGAGVSRSLRPAFLFDHLSMGQAPNPSTLKDNTNVTYVLSCPCGRVATACHFLVVPVASSWAVLRFPLPANALSLGGAACHPHTIGGPALLPHHFFGGAASPFSLFLVFW